MNMAFSVLQDMGVSLCAVFPFVDSQQWWAKSKRPIYGQTSHPASPLLTRYPLCKVVAHAREPGTAVSFQGRDRSGSQRFSPRFWTCSKSLRFDPDNGPRRGWPQWHRRRFQHRLAGLLAAVPKPKGPYRVHWCRHLPRIGHSRARAFPNAGQWWQTRVAAPRFRLQSI